MQSKAKTPIEYIKSLPTQRKEVISRLRIILIEKLPFGFEEVMIYGMLGYVVPHALYPKGYHVDPKIPLPFIMLAAQKNHIALYHSGIYADEKLQVWFRNEYTKYVNTKLDMGKSCIRFKNMNKIPYALIGELAGKMSPNEWILLYEKSLQGKKPPN